MSPPQRLRDPISPRPYNVPSVSPRPICPRRPHDVPISPQCPHGPIFLPPATSPYPHDVPTTSPYPPHCPHIPIPHIPPFPPAVPIPPHCPHTPPVPPAVPISPPSSHPPTVPIPHTPLMPPTVPPVLTPPRCPHTPPLSHTPYPLNAPRCPHIPIPHIPPCPPAVPIPHTPHPPNAPCCPHTPYPIPLSPYPPAVPIPHTPHPPDAPRCPHRALAELLPRWLQDYPEDFGDAAAVGLAERLGAVLGPDAAVGQWLRELRDPTVPPDPPGDPYGDGDGDADPLEILSFQAQEVAEQLTLTEAELFLRLRPYECLGSLWSQRDKKGGHGGCPSVRATVRHFNRVAAAVVTSCLGGAGLRPPQRARLLEKWIRVAQECRALRNFSSLCAIISALQSNPIHRLRHSWGEISRDAQRSYEELSALCSEQNNFSASRRLLLVGPRTHPYRTPYPPHSHPTATPYPGVVPYLGTFLRDLVMLDAAMKDEVEDGWINFEKRRKEFEVLAQLSALQSSCRSYRLQPRPHFQRWLWGLRVLPEGHSHTLSCAIEPPGPPPLSPRPPRPTLVITHFSSLDAPPAPAAPPAPPPAPSLSPPRCHRRSASCGAALSPSGSDCRIVRVRMELHNGSLYKSILVRITSQEKTPAVVTKALEKHGQGGGSAPQFQLVQLLPDHRELPLPPSANVFYAMSGQSCDFALRPRGPQPQ
uniref:Ral guanine nucleotide dissociation stimulator like 2 n=1 Tax=Gallus gallus TaxID=9031 RepID=A0A8V0XAD7_CHICK